MSNTVRLLLVGTGSIFSVENASEWQSHVESRSDLTIEKTMESDIDVRTPKEHLQNIRAVLNPSIAELALLLEVSRQAVYKWLSEDSHPESEKLECIQTLSKISDMFKEAGILRTEILLNMKNSKGISLFELVKTKKPYEEHVKMLLTEAKIMESSYQRSRLTQTKARSTSDWASSVSIPAYPEDIKDCT